ncbi:MAG: transposase [Bacteroidetes bacterium 4572_114]|nr:MAG: transposase [Bacteroidetes bacterium 4572_114]
MASYRQIYYHIVFGTKYRQKTIPDEHCDKLYKYIWGIIKNKNCKLYRINGSLDHLHIMSDLHPSIALADYLRTIKTSSSIWLKTQPEFPRFIGWAEGYAAFTISHSDRHRVIEYIKNQKEHHKKESFPVEYKRLLKEFDVDFDEKYFL